MRTYIWLVSQDKYGVVQDVLVDEEDLAENEPEDYFYCQLSAPIERCGKVTFEMDEGSLNSLPSVLKGDFTN